MKTKRSQTIKWNKLFRIYSKSRFQRNKLIHGLKIQSFRDDVQELPTVLKQALKVHVGGERQGKCSHCQESRPVHVISNHEYDIDVENKIFSKSFQNRLLWFFRRCFRIKR